MTADLDLLASRTVELRPMHFLYIQYREQGTGTTCYTIVVLRSCQMSCSSC